MAADAYDPIPQASAVPYRFRRGRAEFCLITSSKGHWGFPKGIIDPGETPEQTALKESEEEAGLTGWIEGAPIAEYEYQKWGRDLLVAVYLMRVTAVAADWDESDWRERCWCTADEARTVLQRAHLREVFESAVEALAAQGR